VSVVSSFLIIFNRAVALTPQDSPLWSTDGLRSRHDFSTRTCNRTVALSTDYFRLCTGGRGRPPPVQVVRAVHRAERPGAAADPCGGRCLRHQAGAPHEPGALLTCLNLKETPIISQGELASSPPSNVAIPLRLKSSQEFWGSEEVVARTRAHPNLDKKYCVRKRHSQKLRIAAVTLTHRIWKSLADTFE
jgi:hypothetical protein